MATVPTLEESERHLLNVFAKFGIRPGEVLAQVSIISSVNHNRFRSSDLNEALESMFAKGWIEDGQGPGWFRLTEAGFAAI